MPVERYYRSPGLTSGAQDGVTKKILAVAGPAFSCLSTELCFYVETQTGTVKILKIGIFETFAVITL